MIIIALLIIISGLFIYLVWNSGFLTPSLLLTVIVFVLAIDLLIVYLLFSKGAL